MYEVSRETDKTVAWIIKPNYSIRFITYLAVVFISLAVGHSISGMNLATNGINMADFVQMIESALNGMALIGAGIIFLITFENRKKRQRVISAINKLRCVAHIIDMHQLTKDPDTTGKVSSPTPNSPRRDLNKYELNRYLDYCAEMLALISKLGFLYIQNFPDAIATDAVNDLEELTSGLSGKIWQKIMLGDLGDTT